MTNQLLVGSESIHNHREHHGNNKRRIYGLWPWCKHEKEGIFRASRMGSLWDNDSIYYGILNSNNNWENVNTWENIGGIYEIEQLLALRIGN